MTYLRFANKSDAQETETRFFFAFHGFVTN